MFYLVSSHDVFFCQRRRDETSVTSSSTQSGAPEDGQNSCPKHVELTGIINKLLLLHLVVYSIYINDTRSSKYQIMTYIC